MLSSTPWWLTRVNKIDNTNRIIVRALIEELNQFQICEMLVSDQHVPIAPCSSPQSMLGSLFAPLITFSFLQI
jgi:hypothetical protein